MQKISLFSPLAEAAMAALASRSHAWRYWEIEETLEITRGTGPLPVVKIVTVVVRVENRSGQIAERSLANDDDNVFFAIEEASQAPVDSSVKVALKARSRDWLESEPEPFAVFTERSESELSALQETISATLGSTIWVTRLKNSLGYLKSDAVQV